MQPCRSIMDFVEFKAIFKNRIVLSIKELKLYEPSFDDTQLYRWQKKGYIKKLTRGFYIFSDLKVNEMVKFQISNTIYHPSYISLESCLNLYGLIPEVVFSPTAVSSKKAHTVTTSKGTFLYKQIKPELMFGFTVTRFENITYKIATIEKSFLDYLYLNPDIDNLKIANDLRIDLEYFLEQINKEQFKNYLKRFSNKALNTRVRKLLGDEYA